MTSFISVMSEVNMANLGFYAFFVVKVTANSRIATPFFKRLAMTGKQADFARRFLSNKT